MKRKVQIALGMGLGIFLLWLLFRGTDWREVGRVIENAHLSWILAGLLVISVGFVTRILRWGYIVRTAKPVSFRHMFSATQIGFLGNFVLPGRIGEVIRALVLSRLADIPFSKCFAFVALDRVTDLIGLIIVMLVSVVAYHPASAVVLPAGFEVPGWAQGLLEPEAIRVGALSVAVVLVGIIGVFVVLYVNQRLLLRISDALLGLFSQKLAEAAHKLLQQFAEGMHVFRSARDMAKSIFFSLLTWSTFVLSYYCMLNAFGLSYPWYGPFVMLSVLSVAISLPGAPGFVGQFHVAIVLGLILVCPSIELDTARALAIVAHMLNLVLVAILGVYCLYIEKFGLLELSREGVQVEEEAIQSE